MTQVAGTMVGGTVAELVGPERGPVGLLVAGSRFALEPSGLGTVVVGRTAVAAAGRTAVAVAGRTAVADTASTVMDLAGKIAAVVVVVVDTAVDIEVAAGAVVVVAVVVVAVVDVVVVDSMVGTAVMVGSLAVVRVDVSYGHFAVVAF